MEASVKKKRSNKLYFVVNKHGSPWRTRDGRMWVDYLAQGARWMEGELNLPTVGAWLRHDRRVVLKGRPWKAVWLRLPSRVIKARCLPVTDAMVVDEQRRRSC